jgi:pimeloyl-ACP methyl ester carboxylesterase
MVKFIRLALACVFALSLSLPVVVHAQEDPWDLLGCVKDSLPSHDPQYPANQEIVTCIPEPWNGHLVIYAHGYVAPQRPLALPTVELTLLDGTFLPKEALKLGFAFATSSYHKNGYAVKQARKDLNDLLQHFKTLVPPKSLQKVFITGASEGGLIATMLVEKHPGKYDGGLALCGPVGGAPYQINYLGDFRVVFDYFFPDVFPFGTVDVPPDAFEDWETLYVLTIAGAMASPPGATPQLFSVTGAAQDPLDPTSFISTTVGVLFYNIWGTPDLFATAGGIPYDNQTTVYMGSFDDAALNAGVERVQADGRAQSYMRRHYQTTGELERPLVTLHTTLDPVVPFAHEAIYTDLVTSAGSSAFLTSLSVERYGHCNFTAEEVLGAFLLLVSLSGG